MNKNAQSINMLGIFVLAVKNLSLFKIQDCIVLLKAPLYIDLKLQYDSTY